MPDESPQDDARTEPQSSAPLAGQNSTFAGRDSDPTLTVQGASGTTIKLPPAPPVLPGTVLDARYLIVKSIGQGGMGAVYQARDQNVNDRPVAVKFILKSLFKPSDFAMFVQEMQAVARLDAIPGVVRIFDSNLNDRERPYIVTEFVQGWNLQQFIRDQVPPRLERVQLVVDLCHTLHAVHEEGILHRDIKPSNVLVRQKKVGGKWTPVLVDFGLALDRLSEPKTGLNVLGGTPLFMSPEHAQGVGKITRRSDVFSLGVVLYWLLTEQYPFEARSIGVGIPSPKPLPVEHEDVAGVKRGVPAGLARITMKAIAADPVERYHSAGEMGVELQQWLLRETAGARSLADERIDEASRTRESEAARSELGADSIRVPHLNFERVRTEANLLTGVSIGRWKVNRFLGSGSAGLSFSVSEPGRPNRRLKIIYPPAAGHEGVAHILTRLCARTTAFAEADPTIIPFELSGRIVFEDLSTYYLLSDHVQGKDVLDWAATRRNEVQYGGCTADQISVAFRILRALDHARQQPLPDELASSDLGRFHGRLLAGNVFAGPKGPMITDFGLCALSGHVSAPKTRTSSSSTSSATIRPKDPSDPKQMAIQDAQDIGRLLKSFLFVFVSSGIGHRFPSAAELWPDGDTLLQKIRKTIRATAVEGIDAAHKAVEPILRPINPEVRFPTLVRDLLRLIVRDLCSGELTDMGEAARRIAEAAAIGPGINEAMNESLRSA